jgi:hypothetical protein
MRVPEFAAVYGVDFSGAKLAGRNTWIARIEPRRRGRPVLVALDRLETLCGTGDRASALEYLVERVAGSEAALWGFDFPFGLPVELFPAASGWPHQFEFLRAWGEEAYACGVECCRRARLIGDRMHLRRATDADAKAPFDCYHYRNKTRTRKIHKKANGNDLRNSHGSHKLHEWVPFAGGKLHGKLHSGFPGITGVGSGTGGWRR